MKADDKMDELFDFLELVLKLGLALLLMMLALYFARGL